MIDTAAQFCFTHPNGKDISIYRLQNRRGSTVLISNYGAIVTSYAIRMPDGSPNDIVLGFDTMHEYLGKDYLAEYPWFGAAVGRNANRIRNACFELDGKTYRLGANHPPQQLHGGNGGFDRQVWDLIDRGESPAPWIEFRYYSPDGEEGYPGNLDTHIRFELGEDDSLAYAYTATCDQPTVVHLTHHGYFNLNNGKGTIHDHEVKIYGSASLDLDAELVTTGGISPVDGTPYDLRAFKRIGDGLSVIPEYDKSIIIDKRPDQLVAEARSKHAGLLLQVYSDQPVVHFYSGKWIPVVPGKNGNTYGPFSGFCLETQGYANAVNIPHFPTVIVRPGEIYRHHTTYRLYPV